MIALSRPHLPEEEEESTHIYKVRIVAEISYSIERIATASIELCRSTAAMLLVDEECLSAATVLRLGGGSAANKACKSNSVVADNPFAGDRVPNVYLDRSADGAVDGLFASFRRLRSIISICLRNSAGSMIRDPTAGESLAG